MSIECTFPRLKIGQPVENWRSCSGACLILYRARSLRGFHRPLANMKRAIYALLPAGAYTAIVRGVGNATGTAVVEIYNVRK